MATEILHDGRRVVTTRQAAAELGITYDALRKAISDLALTPATRVERTPLYDPIELARALAARPGRGSNLAGTR